MTERWPPIDAPPERIAALRRRIVWTLFAVSALGSTGYIAAVTAGTLVAEELSGTSAIAGLPTAVTTIGTASAASLLSVLMVRRGRRIGLLAGVAIGAGGGVVALIGILAGSIPLFLLGSAMTGYSNGAAQLGRYVAADLGGPERRASTIAVVVWGTTIGAVTGPNLVAPAGAVATTLGLPELAGAYLLTMGFIGLAWGIAWAFLRPEPNRLVHEAAPVQTLGAAATPPPARRSIRQLLADPTIGVAFVTLVAGQVVMVLIMTMTPLHLAAHGHGLATVGFVLSAHTFGMFALSPISGRLTDRYGSLRVIVAGLATLSVAAVLAALAPPDGGVLLTLALFLLGYGWNLGFVAGSALLTSGLGLAERTRVQGLADTAIWSTAALASLASGVIVAGASYTFLGLFGLGLLVVPAAMVLLRGGATRVATAA